jgi:hypothetical protein
VRAERERHLLSVRCKYIIAVLYGRSPEQTPMIFCFNCRQAIYMQPTYKGELIVYEEDEIVKLPEGHKYINENETVDIDLK